MVGGELSAVARFGRAAMATRFEIVIPFGMPRAHEAADAALAAIDRVESRLTVYRDTSEVSRLNRLAAKAPVPVSPELFELLQLCKRVTEETDGAFDVTAGPLIKVWGFFGRHGRVPSSEELVAAIGKVGMRHVTLDGERKLVRFTCPGVEVNFGAIGKGHALDFAAQALRHSGVDSALLVGGESSILATGNAVWPVGLRSADGTRRLGTVRLRSRAMGVSGVTHQHFVYNQQRLGHLLDPRTGHPAMGMALAVAIAPSAAEADALATAFYVLGLDGTDAYCRRHPDVSGLILTDTGRVTPINLADSDWTEAAPGETYAARDDGPYE